MQQDQSNHLTHIVGTFLIQAEGAFLNGAGLGQGEDRNTTVPKTLANLKDRMPYVSSQAWKRWLRNTFQEEYPTEPAAVIKSLSANAKGNTEKIGTEMNPIDYAEDDIFGYMRAQKGQGRTIISDISEDNEDESILDAGNTETPVKKGEKVLAIMRPSPFSASILMSLRKTGWEGVDAGYVHLKEGTPLPYTTKFYNTQLQGIFGLNYGRLGVFRNEGDRVELDPEIIANNDERLLKPQPGDRNIYVLKDNPRKKRATQILKSLSLLRNPAKGAQFATDVSPKVIILAGLTSGNLIFNDLFDDSSAGPFLKIAMLKEIIADYTDRLVTPVFIGIRTGYLQSDNEREIRESFPPEQNQVRIGTPIQVIDLLTELLPQ